MIELNIQILRRGEVADRDPRLSGPIRQAVASNAVLIEDGTANDKPSVMLIGKTQDGQVLVLETTWQLLHMLTGAALGAFGPPTSNFEIHADFAQGGD